MHRKLCRPVWPGICQVRLLTLHQTAHHSHPHTRQKMDPSREGVCERLQHPRSRPALIHRHAYRVRRIVVELVNKLEYLTKLLGESHEKK